MMRVAVMIGSVLLTLALSGCTYSVYPLLAEKDLAHDLDLSGPWQLVPDLKSKDEVQEKKALIELSGFGQNSAYDFQYAAGRDPVDYVMKIGRLGDQTFAEFSELDTDGPPIVRGLPVYVIAKLELVGGVLTLREIDDAKCRKLLARDELPYLAHLVWHAPDIERTVMTVPTSQLQKFVQRHHQELFTGTSRVWRRVAAQDSEPSSAPANQK